MTGEPLPGPARSETARIGVVVPCIGVAETGVVMSVPDGGAVADVAAVCADVAAFGVVVPGASFPGDCAVGSEAVVVTGADVGAASVVVLWLAHGGAAPGGGWKDAADCAPARPTGRATISAASAAASVILLIDAPLGPHALRRSTNGKIDGAFRGAATQSVV
jgi:hypothetical protein